MAHRRNLEGIFREGMMKMTYQRVNFSRTDLEIKKSQLEKLEPKEKKISTKKDVILFLKKTIHEMLEKNYDFKEISAILKDMDISASVSFLRKIIGENKIKKSKKILTQQSKKNPPRKNEKNLNEQKEEQDSAKFEIPQDTDL